MSMGFMLVNMQYLQNMPALANFSFAASMTQGPNPETPNSDSGYGFASFLLGTGTSGSAGFAAAPAQTTRYFGWYFQDDWHASRKLTVNLGLRYDIQQAPTDRFNRLDDFNFSGENPISQAVGFSVPGYLNFLSGAAYSPQYTNFAPRVGLAYSPTSKLVMRAGFGTFFNPTFAAPAPMDGFNQTTTYVGTTDGIHPVNLLNNPFPNGLIQPPGRSEGALTNVGLITDAGQDYYPTPYMLQWLFDVQYRLTPNNILDVGYFGNHGVKLPVEGISLDQLPTQELALGTALLNQVTNPFYGYITQSSCGLNTQTVTQEQLLLPYPEFCGVANSQTPGGLSRYEALEVNFTHRWSSGMQFLVSYTNSKFIDDTEGIGGWGDSGSSAFRNNYNIAADTSLDANDIPQSLVVSYILQLPVGRDRKFARNASRLVNAAIGGWQLTGITTAKEGFPLSISDANNLSYSDGGMQRPELVGNPHVANPTVQDWFNTSAFAQPAPFTFGNVGRFMPNLRAPGIYNWDLAVQKTWAVWERSQLQFRMEMFDAFNHTNFYAPGQTFGVGGFGIVAGALEPRDIQFAFKLIW